MRYTYKTAKGNIAIDIPDDWGNVLIRLDKDEEANQMKHRRNDRKKVGRLVSLDCIVALVNDCSPDLAAAGATEEVHAVEVQEERKQLYAAFAALPERTRRVVLARTVDNETTVAVGKREGVSKQRIDQINKEGLQRLRRAMQEQSA